MSAPRTLFEKIWSEHVIVVSPQGEELLYADFNLINEGQSFLAFDQLRIEGRSSRRPEQHLAVTDHYLPTINRALGPSAMPNPEFRRVVEMLDENARDFALLVACGCFVRTRAGGRVRCRDRGQATMCL